MTLSQIQYFLETARYKNISVAAKHLYITQPTLGRQLTAIEKELNMQLMIRSNKGIRLTPAGIVLQEEFEKLMSVYKNGVEKAAQASQGFSGTLSVGILEQLKVAELIPPIVDYFESNYPNIDISIKSLSFKELVDGLYQKKLDASISLDVNFVEQPELLMQNLKRYTPAFAVPISHPLSRKAQLEYQDFSGIPLAIVDREDCKAGVAQVEERCRQYGGFYPNLYFTSSMKDAVLWVESGKKCAILNMEMKIADSDMVKMYPIEVAREEGNYIQLAYMEENDNIALRLLKEFLEF